MNRSNMALLVAVMVCAAAGSFLATRVIGQPAAQPPTAEPLCEAVAGGSNQASHSPLASWLRMTPGQARALAQGEFSQEAGALNQGLENERTKLILLFETPGSSDEQILQQVERVIDAHDALERYVARYVVGLRHELTPQQQRRLMGLCAASMRGAGSCQNNCPCAAARAAGTTGLCRAAQQGNPPCSQP
jgi:hypothetical protein